ncbi:hypothetical protein BZL39_N00140 [Zygosaccharomyces parabailii]|nr:hypothetical protein BZL39_N00140 [Zygosaccharomyces parabailii]
MKNQKPVEFEISFNTIETHPFARNYLLLKCEIEYGDYETDRMSGSKTEQTSYISKDFGRIFERILAPVEDYNVTPDVVTQGTECWFAVSSQRSTLSKELICGVHSINAIDEQGNLTMDKRALFYSPDLGKTMRLVEELGGLPELNLKIFSCAALVTARENIDDHQIEKLWVSTGGAFKRATLPLEADYPSLGQAFEYLSTKRCVRLFFILLFLVTVKTTLEGSYCHFTQ